MGKIKKSKKLFENVPEGAIVGLNYSGMHDTSVAVLSPNGLPLLAVSLERITRVKQDGRSPKKLLEGMPWGKVRKVAISVSQSYDPPKKLHNDYHPIELDNKNYYDRSHGEEFIEQLDFIPNEKIFVPHHKAHAASAFWLSGFSDATCLVYDGGMSNEEWFGGVYDATTKKGVIDDQLFSASCYSNVTKVYTAVTALLGFQPLKHEGKITGLAAYGKPTKRCRDLVEKWLHEPSLLDGLIVWQDMYQDVSVPTLAPIPGVVEALKHEIRSFSIKELAATVQVITEEHIVEILKTIHKKKQSKNLCLSGGLFANVKVNQRASEAGFDQIYICPSMSDDGTALGAALQVAEIEGDKFSQKPIESVYLGPKYNANELASAIRNSGTQTTKVANISLEIARLLNDGAIVAVFDGPMEFGPRALGNRSILATADSNEINRKLNGLLHRTEFMPFAPICREEDAHLLFEDIDKVWRAAHFMTVTVNCTKKMAQLHPAVVHFDGTARPQLVSRKSNRLIHDILTNYAELSGKFALVNTSFNIHEEPIIMSPDDALKGFYEAGIDAILLRNKIIKLSENPSTELSYVRNKLNEALLSTKRTRVEVYDQSVKALQANERADSAIALANQAETRANNAEAITAQANERADSAIALANQAETRAKMAEVKTIAAEVNTTRANERVKTVTKHMIEKEQALAAGQLEINHLNAHIQQLQNELDASMIQIDELNHSSHHWYTVSYELEHELRSVYGSKSWRITLPLRKCMQFVKWILSLTKKLFIAVVRAMKWFARGSIAWLTLKPGSRPRRTARLLLLNVQNWILSHPKVKTKVLSLLQRFPLCKAWLKSLLNDSSLRSIQSPSLNISDDLPKTTEYPTPDSSLKDLTPQARQIYRDLKLALKRQKG